jgi:hypothetical protein
MPISLLKLFILVIPDLNHPIFYPECIPIIIPYLMVMDFYRPIVDVLPIKKLYPFFLLGDGK